MAKVVTSPIFDWKASNSSAKKAGTPVDARTIIVVLASSGESVQVRISLVSVVAAGIRFAPARATIHSDLSAAQRV